MARIVRTLFFGWSLMACASAPEATPAPKHAGEHRPLQRALAEHTRLQQEFAKVESADRSRCEFQAGDCMVLVAENRDKLISVHNLRSCYGIVDSTRENECIKKELEKRGKFDELASHLTYDNMCIQRILGCTSDLEEQTVAGQNRQRFEMRRREIETSSSGMSAWHDAEVAQEKLRYLRATLPPPAIESCVELAEVKSCGENAKAKLKHFEEQLRADAYDQKAATSEYDALKRQEASCSDPELNCIFQTLQRYGSVSESRKFTQQNMDLLEQRQALASRIGPEAVTACIIDPATDHQERIVDAYKIYAHEPVLYFRTQLEKAFIAMHQAQVSCLTGKKRSSHETKVSAPTASK